MQHIPDKEFDKLFKEKFTMAEIEPSANLWSNIEREFAPKRKRIIPIFWMAAASVLIAFSAILFLQKTDKIQLRGKEEQVNNATAAENLISPINDKIEEINQTQVQQTNRTFVSKVRAKSSVEEKLNNSQLAMQPIKEIERLPIKQQEVLLLVAAPIKEEAIQNPIVIAQLIPKQEIENNTIGETENFSERKGIRNVGDLVNFVVDKVDKRDKKLIKFNTDDDDNSSLVAINIGFLKLNKKNK